MTELLYCILCNAPLRRIDLRRLQHVEIRCVECGEWSTFGYDPTHYVLKAGDD